MTSALLLILISEVKMDSATFCMLERVSVGSYPLPSFLFVWVIKCYDVSANCPPQTRMFVQFVPSWCCSLGICGPGGNLGYLVEGFTGGRPWRSYPCLVLLSTSALAWCEWTTSSWYYGLTCFSWQAFSTMSQNKSFLSSVVLTGILSQLRENECSKVWFPTSCSIWVSLYLG